MCRKKMEPFFQVQAGILKNKKFPLKVSRNGHLNFTPSILKKAVFDKIESEALSGTFSLQELVFVDLFAGSGQMGIEALSRGFKKVHLFEVDRGRFGQLKKNAEILMMSNLWIHNKDGFRYYNVLEEEEFGVFFLDPPYPFWKEATLQELIKDLNKVEGIKKIYIQSPEKLQDKNSKRFGSNYLTEIRDGT